MRSLRHPASLAAVLLGLAMASPIHVLGGDLALALVPASTLPAPGETVSIFVTVANNGPGALTGVRVDGTVDLSLDQVGGTCGDVVSGGALAIAIGNLPADESWSCSLELAPVACGPAALGATATADTIDLTPADASATVLFNGEANVVGDPGFETQDGSWTLASQRFGTPLCGPACGDGAGTVGPREGTAWVWFGGFTAGLETASVSQTVAIPATPAATLSFWLWIGLRSGNDGDWVRVQIDGEELWRATESDPAYAGGYARVAIDVGRFADGLPHLLRISTQTEGAGPLGMHTNFSLDDAALETCGQPAVPLFEDDFSSGIAGWFTRQGSWFVQAPAGVARLTADSAATNLITVKRFRPRAAPFTSGRFISRVTLRPLAGSVPAASMVFALRDSTHYRYLKIYQNRLVCGELSGTVNTVLPKMVPPTPLALKHRYIVRLDIAADGGLDVALDGIPVGSCQWPTPTLPGGLGYRVQSAAVYFDDIRVWDASAFLP